MPTRTRPRLALLATSTAALAIVATACSGSGSGSGGDSKAGDENGGGRGSDSAPRGVVSAAEAKKIVDEYVKANNRANKKQDPDLLATVEGGALLEQSKAVFQLDELSSAKEKAEARAPFYYVDRKYVIPTGTSWFAIRTYERTSEGKKQPRQITVVFDRETKGGAWKAVWSGAVDTKGAPALADDGHGNAVAVTEPSGRKADSTGRSGGTGSSDTLSRLDDAVIDLYATGGEKAGAQLATTETTKWMTKFPKDQNKMVSPLAKAEYQPGKTPHKKVYALKTKDGGTLAFFNVPVQEYLHGTRPDSSITPSDQMGVFLGNKKPSLVFLTDYLHQTEAFIPARGTRGTGGKGAGKTQLLTSEYVMTGSEGSHASL